MLRLVFFLFLLPFCVMSFNPSTIDSRIKTVVYSPSVVFPVYAKYGFYLHIDLPISEQVVEYRVGDASAWNITEIRNNYHNGISLRPLEDNARTNMTVYTTKRKYEFDLYSYSNQDDVDESDLTYSIRFYYPDDARIDEIDDLHLITPQRRENLMSADDAIYQILMSDSINRDYTITGDYELIRPIEIFDDGKMTYILFDKERHPRLPNILVRGVIGATNSRRDFVPRKLMMGDYVVLDVVAQKLLLTYPASGDHRSRQNQRVVIENNFLMGKL